MLPHLPQAYTYIYIELCLGMAAASRDSSSGKGSIASDSSYVYEGYGSTAVVLQIFCLILLPVTMYVHTYIQYKVNVHHFVAGGCRVLAVE